MALVLLADDDANFRTTIQTALAGEGHEVLAAANGDEAVALYEQSTSSGREPDVLILDVLMPKRGGLETADALKKTGCRAHIIFMSGVFKTSQHAKDAESKYGARGYLSKPFGNRRILELVASLPSRAQTSQGVDVPVPNLDRTSGSMSLDRAAINERLKKAMPADGSLLENPVFHMLWRIESERHTGVLDLFGIEDLGRFRLFFFKGRLTLAQSSRPQSNLGVQLIRDGHLTAEMFEQARATAVERGRGLHEIIKAEGWADDPIIKLAYKALVPAIVAECIALSGQFRWTETDAFSRLVPAAPMSPMDVAIDGLRQAKTIDLEPHINPRGPLRIAPGENWAEMCALLDRACGSTSLERAINGRASIAMLVNAARSEKDRAGRMRQVYLLMSTQGVIASEQVIPMETPTDQPAVTPAPTPAPAFHASAPQAAHANAAPESVTYAAPEAPIMQHSRPTPVAPGVDDEPVSANDRAAREKIREKLLSLADKDEFGILDVSEEASSADIKRTYFELAREFHTDSFAGMNLGPAALDLDRLFAMIAEAYDALTDPKKRGEIDAKRMMEKAGMSTDVGALMEAENNFTKGQRLLERGEMIAAAKLFEHCCGVNPANTEWRCHFVFTNWWVRRDPKEGVKAVKDLETAFKEMPGVAQIAAFAGQIAAECGDERKARINFRKALNIDEANNLATRGMRAAQARKAESEKKPAGLMGRFLKR